MSTTEPNELLMGSPVRRTIIDTLSDLPEQPTPDQPATRSLGMTAAQLAKSLSLHVTTVRFHLDQLLEADLIEAHDVKLGVGRPRRHYAITAGALETVERPEAYKLVSEVLADAMKTAQEDGVHRSAEEAAALWLRRNAHRFIPNDAPRTPARSSGAFLAKAGVLVDLLEAWGYSPTVRTSDEGHTVHVDIGECPLRQLAIENPSVTCGIHRGVIRGALDEIGEESATLGLLPFSEKSSHCIAWVKTSAEFNPRSEPLG